MAITAQSLIRRAAEQLQDVECVRWSAAKLVRDLNDGQRELAMKRPDAVMRTLRVPLVPGARQSLPSEAMQLSDAVRNAASGLALRKVEMAAMDAAERGWQARAGKVDVVHFMYDLRDPRVFYVYPPAAPGAALDLVCPVYPQDIAEPAPGAGWAEVSGVLGVADEWANALLDFVLYRAWAMDAEFGGNAELASRYLGLFNAALAAQLQSATVVAPTT